MRPSDGRDDFDFFFGHWQVQHRKLRERLAGNQVWDSFGAAAVRSPC